MRLHSSVPEEKLKKEIEKFIGKIKQLPPVRSRVKRAIREREVKSFEILEISEKEGKDVLFKTKVQAGTYIRKLCDDIGKEIGGAHMLELRRIKAGIFEEKGSYTLYQLEQAINEWKKGSEVKLREMLIPAEIISQVLPVLQLKPDNLKQLLTGKPIFKQDLEDESINLLKKLNINEGEKACAFTDNKFIGCYKAVSDGDIVAKPEFVLN